LTVVKEGNSLVYVRLDVYVQKKINDGSPLFVVVESSSVGQ